MAKATAETDTEAPAVVQELIKKYNAEYVNNKDNRLVTDNGEILQIPDFAALKAAAEIAVVPGAVDKATLVGVPFVIVHWEDDAYSENFGASYAKVMVKTENEEIKTFVDFGSGIKDVLHAFRGEHGIKPVFCAEGLRVSNYGPHKGKNGEDLPGGTTYYLS